MATTTSPVQLRAIRVLRAEWFSGGVFIGAGPWFRGPATSTATLITASIRITAMLVHIRTVETSPLITSTETKCVMDAATQGVESPLETASNPKQKGAT